jgi:exopolysaccharide biosynthesis predicted pyruvyltransferase EpsI
MLWGDSGAIKLGRHMVRWAKVNWDNTPVQGLNWQDAKGYNERAFLKYDAGFRLHGEAELVVTDKLHGHIISTLIGVPHILLNSKLGKNLAYHDTWTLDCENTRIAENFEQTLEYATMFFEKEFREGRWKPSVEEKTL